MAAVECADADQLRWWLNELPADAGDDEWAVMQRIIRRLREFGKDPYRPARSDVAPPLQAPRKPRPKPAPIPASEAASPGYFKSLFT